MKYSVLTSILILLACTGFTQRDNYEVFGVNTNPQGGTYALVTLDTLQEAQTLEDIYYRYRSNWVRRYLSVEVASACEGRSVSAKSADDRLRPEQLAILKTAKNGCRIDVKVNYIPENNLKNNPPREMNFSVTTIPIYEAKYPGGRAALLAHLKKNLVDKVTGGDDPEVALAIARFTVNAEGKVTDARVLQSTEVREADRLMLDVLGNLPAWQPARDADGIPIAQEFEFRMGSMLLRCDYHY